MYLKLGTRKRLLTKKKVPPHLPPSRPLRPPPHSLSRLKLFLAGVKAANAAPYGYLNGEICVNQNQ